MKMKLAGKKYSIRTKQWENVHGFVVPEDFHWSVCIIWVLCNLWKACIQKKKKKKTAKHWDFLRKVEKMVFFLHSESLRSSFVLSQKKRNWSSLCQTIIKNEQCGFSAWLLFKRLVWFVLLFWCLFGYFFPHRFSAYSLTESLRASSPYHCLFW